MSLSSYASTQCKNKEENWVQPGCKMHPVHTRRADATRGLPRHPTDRVLMSAEGLAASFLWLANDRSRAEALPAPNHSRQQKQKKVSPSGSTTRTRSPGGAGGRTARSGSAPRRRTRTPSTVRSTCTAARTVQESLWKCRSPPSGRPAEQGCLTDMSSVLHCMRA
jgi:hypothetical protein